MVQPTKRHSDACMPFPTGRRGVAYLLVLAITSVVAILAAAYLSEASLGARVAADRRAVAEAEGMVRSGVEIVKHYLLNPGDSPVALVTGTAGDAHYPGGTAIMITETGSVDVVVTNPDVATYDVTVTGRSVSATGETVESKAIVRLVGVGDWHALAGVQLAGDVTLNSRHRFDNGLATMGSYLSGGSISGTIYAKNYSGQSGWAPAPVLPLKTDPGFAALNLARAASSSNRYYLWNGQRCQMQVLASTTISSTPTPGPANPGSVFVYTGSSPLTLAIPSGGQFEGTLIVTQAPVYVSGDNKVRPQADLPGLLVKHRIVINMGAALEVENALYTAGGVWSSSLAQIFSLGMVPPDWLPGGLYYGRTRVNGSESRSEVPSSPPDLSDLTDVGIEYDRVQVESWTTLY